MAGCNLLCRICFHIKNSNKGKGEKEGEREKKRKKERKKERGKKEEENINSEANKFQIH